MAGYGNLRVPSFNRRWLIAFWLFAIATPGPGAEVTVELRDAAGFAVPGAVLALTGPMASKAPAVASPVKVVDQRNRMFLPQVTVIRRGSEVRFPNSDAVSHHVYSFAQPNSFELPLYKGDTRPTVRFDHEGIVTLGCNIHDSMLGYIVVVDTPFYAITDAAGVMTLHDVPAGNYQLQAWSQRLEPSRMLDAGRIEIGSQPVSQTASVPRRLRGEPSSGTSFAGSEY